MSGHFHKKYYSVYLYCILRTEFPAGNVDVTLYCGGVCKGTTCLRYYTTMGEINRLLKQAADPLYFMCQVTQNNKHINGLIFD